jgi:hypothetical protein
VTIHFVAVNVTACLRVTGQENAHNLRRNPLREHHRATLVDDKKTFKSAREAELFGAMMAREWIDENVR